MISCGTDLLFAGRVAVFALALLGGGAAGQNVIVEDWEAQQGRLAKDGVAFQLSYT